MFFIQGTARFFGALRSFMLASLSQQRLTCDHQIPDAREFDSQLFRTLRDLKFI